MIELIRQYMAILRKGPHEPGAEAELEKIYMHVIRQDPNHRLARLHEMVMDGVSINIAEQLRDLLAEEITALEPIAAPQAGLVWHRTPCGEVIVAPHSVR